MSSNFNIILFSFLHFRNIISHFTKSSLHVVTVQQAVSEITAICCKALRGLLKLNPLEYRHSASRSVCTPMYISTLVNNGQQFWQLGKRGRYTFLYGKLNIEHESIIASFSSRHNRALQYVFRKIRKSVNSYLSTQLYIFLIICFFDLNYLNNHQRKQSDPPF